MVASVQEQRYHLLSDWVQRLDSTGAPIWQALSEIEVALWDGHVIGCTHGDPAHPRRVALDDMVRAIFTYGADPDGSTGVHCPTANGAPITLAGCECLIAHLLGGDLHQAAKNTMQLCAPSADILHLGHHVSLYYKTKISPPAYPLDLSVSTRTQFAAWQTRLLDTWSEHAATDSLRREAEQRIGQERSSGTVDRRSIREWFRYHFSGTTRQAQPKEAHRAVAVRWDRMGDSDWKPVYQDYNALGLLLCEEVAPTLWRPSLVTLPVRVAQICCQSRLAVDLGAVTNDEPDEIIATANCLIESGFDIHAALNAARLAAASPA